MKKGINNHSQSDEGRRILYRLLLLAVAVVYALVFVLDYLLQMHFTFFLLLSLFGFVILMLLYMWFRVWNQREEPEKATIDEPGESIPESTFGIDEVFDDVIFTISASTGLTVSCSDSAVELFEAGSKEELTGIDLASLFDKSWLAEDRKQIKVSLGQTGKADKDGIFRTLKGNTFSAKLLAIRKTRNNTSLLFVRIIPVQIAEQKSVVQEPGQEWLDDAAFPMAFIGLNYHFQRANKAFASLTGYTEEELTQKSVIDLLHPEDRQLEKRNLSALFRGEVQESRRERRMIRRNNEVIWVSLNASLSRDAEGHPKFIISMAENITQQKRLEQVFSEYKVKLASLVENAEFSVVTVDRRHTIRMINTKLTDLLFAQTGIVVETGFNFLDILPGAYHKDYLGIHKRAFEGEHFVIEKVFHVHGRRSDIEIVVTPVREEGGLVRTISIFAHDISERKKMEMELQRARQEAEAATEAKSGFLATMSHEIRTPLNGVIGMGRLLSQTPLTPKQQDFVDSILLSGDALLSVINDILDFSKIESSKMELEHKPFAIKRCIEETFDLQASKAMEKNLSLHYSIARDVPAYIYGDITRLRQVLMNLVSNAIKFTPKGKITISVSLNAMRGDKAEIRFDVIDTGIGIPKDKIDRLFRSFSQVDAGTAKTYGGTGLGLAISKNLVELMGGKIRVESKEGEGSDFIFTIVTDVAEASEMPRQKSGTNRLANSYVLIISDDKAEAGLYADYFKRWGMIPQIAESVGGSAKLISERKDFNLVLIDAQLITDKPLHVAEDIRNIRTKEDLPIVLFNVLTGDDVLFDYTSNVISAVIPKNVDRSKVLDILISVFSVEEHQRTRDEHAMKTLSKRLADEVPARILIAEDNAINQKLAQNIFEGLGYKPVIVSNGLQVIDNLRKQAFDLIFMDVQMPDMDGFEATRFIRNKLIPEVRPVIIAMTAFALEGDKEKCIEAGMDDYISKPFLIEEIVERIRKWKEGNGSPLKESPVSKQKDIINHQSLNRLKEMMADGDGKFFKEVLRMFAEQGNREVKKIVDLYAQKNLVQAATVAHKLKGSALNIGADALAETCRRIEILGKEMDESGMKPFVSRLAAEFGQTMAELKAFM